MTNVCLFLCFSFGLAPGAPLNIPTPLLANSSAETSLPVNTSMYELNYYEEEVLNYDWSTRPIEASDKCGQVWEIGRIFVLYMPNLFTNTSVSM